MKQKLEDLTKKDIYSLLQHFCLLHSAAFNATHDAHDFEVLELKLMTEKSEEFAEDMWDLFKQIPDSEEK